MSNLQTFTSNILTNFILMFFAQYWQLPVPYFQCISGVTEDILSKGYKLDQVKAIGITNQRETTVAWHKTSGLPLQYFNSSWKFQVLVQKIYLCLYHLLVQKNYFDHVQTFLTLFNHFWTWSIFFSLVKDDILPYNFAYRCMVKNIWPRSKILNKIKIFWTHLKQID